MSNIFKKLPEHEPKTIKEICETIEKSMILKKKDGTHPTAEEIFNYSPTGELYMLGEWYQVALLVLTC